MQTAVEYLQEHLKTLIEEDKKGLYKLLFEQAKEMEKQQIMDAFDEGSDDGFYGFSYRSEQYYNETYGSKGDENFKQFSLYEHKETIATADTPTSSQTEISDEEIKKAAHEHGYEHHSFFTAATSNQKKLSWIAACKWYREQLKKK